MFESVSRSNSQARLQKIKNIKSWAIQSLGINGDVSLLVTELRCTEPGCSPLETVIAVLHPDGASEQYKIHHAVDDLTESVLMAALLRHSKEGEYSHEHDK